MQIINQVVSFEQAPAKWSFWARYNCISDKALAEDSETAVSVSKLGDRAVQDTEHIPCIDEKHFYGVHQEL